MNNIPLIELQIAEQGDITSIADLHTLSWQQTYKTLLKDDYLQNQVAAERLALWQQRFADNDAKQHVIIAKNNHDLVGFICVYADKSDTLGSLLDNLHVHPNAKGQGIGKRLIQQATQWLKQHATHPSLYLEVLAGNEHAIVIYEKLGAKRIKDGVWHAPCGSQVEEYVYQWQDLNALLL